MDDFVDFPRRYRTGRQKGVCRRTTLTEEQKAYQIAYRKQWRAENRDHVRSVQKAYDDAHQEEHRTRSRQAQLATYGLTEEMWVEYFDAQEGCCGFCGNPLPKDKTKIATDHDHTTGLFRSLTHLNCNAAIGLAEAHFTGYMENYR